MQHRLQKTLHRGRSRGSEKSLEMMFVYFTEKKREKKKKTPEKEKAEEGESCSLEMSLFF